MTSGAKDNPSSRRLAFFSLGFFRPALRKRLIALGIELVLFGIGQVEGVVVWGRKPVSKRGMHYAQKKRLSLLTIEDGFIRSLDPGWADAPHSLTFDHSAAYFDASATSDLDKILGASRDDAPQDIRAQMALQMRLGISKYNATPKSDWPHSGYVLVVDQVRDDQSIKLGGANAESFENALTFALENFPDDEIFVRGHPAGKGYYSAETIGRARWLSDPVNPVQLVENAKAVVVVTSQMGMDAIFAGHRPFVFGKPFYAGWGLSDDQVDLEPKGALTVEAFYDGVINRYCQYFSQDGTKSDAVTEIFALHDQARQVERTRVAVTLKDMRAWKKPYLKKFFPHQDRAQVARWGGAQNSSEWTIEDGFLRSKGLGAKLVPPLSLVLDKTGIYFDPNQASDLEAMIHARASMDDWETKRAAALRELIVNLGVSKYNLPPSPIAVPDGVEVVLVVGQVENDRSVLLGATGTVKTNAQLLEAARAAHPDAHIIYKPHPDVLAGLRAGEIEARGADQVYEGLGLDALWPVTDRLVTLTSLTGFEALMRGIEVSCFGMPFYADWGLTQDFAPSTKRRGKASLDALVYATLIDYPLYFDPVTEAFTTPEVIARRIANDQTKYPWHLRAMSRIQQDFYRAKSYARKASSSK